MRIAVLAATGATGHHLLTQALERGHDVVAVVRDPTRLRVPSHPRLRVATADVHDPASVADALADADAVVSGLGTTKKGRPGTLTAGATALATALTTARSRTAARAGTAAAQAPQRAPHVVWLSAFGSGASARPAGPLTRLLLKAVLGSQELADKAGADDVLLPAGASVLHAGPLTNGPPSATRRTVALPDAPRRLLPAGVSRATVAAEMLDEAERPQHAGRVAVPLR